MDDPYARLDPVRDLDSLLAQAQDAFIKGSKVSIDSGTATDLQKAAFQLIAPTLTVASGIRELIRSGLLVPALILVRAVIERTATVSYLMDAPDALTLWEAGWPHRSRPPLRERVKSMFPQAPTIVDQMMDGISTYNSMVHGDPDAARQSLIQLPASERRIAIDHDYGSPQRASAIALETGVILAYLTALIGRVFPPPVARK